MAIPTSTLAQIAFKNLLGKSQVQKTFGVGNESYGYFQSVPSTNVWSSRIPENDPSTAEGNQIAVKVVASLTQIDDSLFSSKYLSYQAQWGPTPSTFGAKDPKTNQPFEYGKGSLKDIGSSSNIYDFIPDSYGRKYQVKPYVTYPTDFIAPGDTREWVFQYSSGILYQDNITSSTYQFPTKIEGYFYIGNKLSSLDPTGPSVIRVSATGPEDGIYYATNSVPFISTYSVTNLFLVDFAYGNTQSVSLNINYLGTLSVYKHGLTGLSELSSGQITGGSGSTAGPTYYLTYNQGLSSSYFLFYEQNPSQLPGQYTSEAITQNRLGGVDRGFSFDKVTHQDMFTNLLYPELVANFNSVNLSFSSLSQSRIPNHYFIDLGRTLNGVLDFGWSINNASGLLNSGSVSIADITSVSTPTPTWPAPFVGQKQFTYNSGSGTISVTYSISTTVPDSRYYRVAAKRTDGTIISKITAIEWTNRAYFGSSTFSTLSPLGLTSLSSQLTTQSIGVYTITGTQGYKYIAFPNNSNYSFANISYYNLPVVLATNSYTLVDSYGHNYMTMSITNSYNYNTIYRVYRTMNQINGTLSVNITN